MRWRKGWVLAERTARLGMLCVGVSFAASNLLACAKADQAPSSKEAPREDPETQADDAPPPPPAPVDTMDPTTTEPATLEEAIADLERANEQLEGILGESGAVPLTSGSARCDKACSAFASLERAADGICRLAKDDPKPCDDARATVEEKRERVAACDCSM